MWPFYLILLIFLGIILLPFIVVFLILNLFATGLAQLGFSPQAGIIILLLMIWGSFINIPLGKSKKIKVKRDRFFGLWQEEVLRRKGLALNLGGGLIPLIIAAVLLPALPPFETVFAVAVVSLVSYKAARFVPKMGVAMSPILPTLAAIILALILAPESPERLAFVAGVLGVIIGGDLMHLPKVLKSSKGVMSIGGAGVFDGIFLVGILAALLAGL